MSREWLKQAFYGFTMVLAMGTMFTIGYVKGRDDGYNSGYSTGESHMCSYWLSTVQSTFNQATYFGDKAEWIRYIHRIASAICIAEKQGGGIK